jgi:hypothetical protein
MTVKDERKIRLAVEAHIRHAHTEYKDMLEAGVDRQTARDRVWDSVQDLRDKWGKNFSFSFLIYASPQLTDMLTNEISFFQVEVTTSLRPGLQNVQV